MAYHQQLPHPALAGSIKCFWAIRRFFTPEYPVFEILPDGYAELIFTFGGPCYLIRDNTPIVLPNPFIVGLLDSPIYFNATGDLQVMAVRIYPWAIATVTGCFNDAAYQELMIELNKFVKKADISGAMAHMGAFLKKQLANDQPDIALTKAGQIIRDTNGTVKLKTLPGLVYMSARKLQRLFLKAAGQTPKAVARKMRFEIIRDRIWLNPDIHFTQLAYELGFADQAHLNHEFRHFSNKTPSEFAKEAMAAKKYLAEHSVAFLQGIEAKQ